MSLLIPILKTLVGFGAPATVRMPREQALQPITAADKFDFGHFLCYPTR